VNRTPPESEIEATGQVQADQPGAASRAFTRTRFSVAWPRLRWWVEVLIIGFGYLLYEFIQGSAPDHEKAAFAHSHDIDHLESWLRIDIERSVNHFVNARPVLASVTGYYYDSMHYLITPMVLLWLWHWRKDAYARWRSALVSASLAALLVYWLYPVAPPRLALSNIIDTLVTRHVMNTTAQGGSGNLVNQFAAMPSLHVGWALWSAIAVVATTKVWWRHLAWLYPVATTFVVMGTGNHYLLDGVGGAVFIVLGVALTRMQPVVDTSVKTA
jgi:hypothetical protein